MMKTNYVSMPGVHEYVWGFPVNLIQRDGRWVIQTVHDGCKTSEVDLNDLLVYLADFQPFALDDCPVALFLGHHPVKAKAKD